MVKLRVIGSSDDNSQLILSNRVRGRRGTHVVPIDRRLLDVLQDAMYSRRETERPAVTSRSAPTAVPPPRVAPRELQRLLRSGQTPQQVARATGVDIGYVEQFFPPVLYERAGIVREARGLYLQKRRLGVSGLPLGEAASRNLVQRRVRLTSEVLDGAWSATRQEGDPWTVTLSFPFRGRARRARWRFDPRTRRLEAANKLAADIGWVPNGVSRRAAAAAAPARGAAKRKTAKRKTAKRKTAKRKTAKRKTAKRAPKRRTVRRRPARRRR